MSTEATTTALVWLTILKEGGYWTVIELRDHLVSRSEKTISSAVYRLVDQNALDQKDPAAPGGPQRFGVTSDCMVPRGILLSDVLDVRSKAAV